MNEDSSIGEQLMAYAQRRDGEVKEELTRFYNRTGYMAAEHATPVSELLASEEMELDEWAVQKETAVRLLQWIGADGPDPATCLQRLFVLGDHMMVEPFCLLTLREKAKLFDDSHGAQLWRRQRLCKDPLMRKGLHSISSAGEKGRKASASAAEAQRGNSNRKNGPPKKERRKKNNPKKHHAKHR